MKIYGVFRSEFKLDEEFKNISYAGSTLLEGFTARENAITYAHTLDVCDICKGKEWYLAREIAPPHFNGIEIYKAYQVLDEIICLAIKGVSPY